MRKCILILVFLGLLYPCDCAPPPTPEEAYETSDVVFSGEVTNTARTFSQYCCEFMKRCKFECSKIIIN